jgi:diguanylate cyclase (GGDEF)-like protein/PAS domain S-box-containing protein
MNRSLAKYFLQRVSHAFVRFQLHRFLPWLLLAIFLFVTYQLWKSAQRETELALQTEFDFRVQDARRKVEQRMLGYEQLLRGVQGLFAATPGVSRAEFRAYARILEIEKNYPGIQSLGFTLLVPRENKDRHIAAVRKEGYPLYTIRPEGARNTYTSLIYIEPFSGRNLLAFGYDTYADPVRRAAMERARDTGLNTISARIKLVQEADSYVQAGFLMWLPVYKNGAAHHTLAERRANIAGWVGVSFRMDDLMASIFDRNDSRLDIEIYDGREVSDKTFMHAANKKNNGSDATASHFHSISLLEIAGHHWTMVISSLPGFEERMNDQKSGLIALSGITVSILLSFISGILVYSRTRAVQSAQALNQELTERKRAESGMRLAAKVFDTVDAAVLVTDEYHRIIKVNPAFTAITGYSAYDAIGNTTQMLSSGAHPPEFYKVMWDTLKATGSWQGEISNRRKNGEFYTEWLSINEVRDDEGRLTHYVALFSDISERKAAEEHMHNLAHYDALTGLPNRTLLSDRLQQAITAAKRERSNMALMFIDLDKFKPVNDTLGHHIGDLLLKEVAKRMQDCLRESDSAARIGGDEFVVLLPLIEAESDAVEVAEKIRHALNLPFELAGHSLNISSSIGVAVYPEHGSDEKSLLKNADTAMYYAKGAGRNNVTLYASGMKRDMQ